MRVVSANSSLIYDFRSGALPVPAALRRRAAGRRRIPDKASTPDIVNHAGIRSRLRFYRLFPARDCSLFTRRGSGDGVFTVYSTLHED